MEPAISGDVLAGELPELLEFCARAEALIAELLLLSDRVPSRFFDPRFDLVLFDLRYFESPREYEARIDASAELQALEDELNDSSSNYMQRFFLLTNAIVEYHKDLTKFLSDLHEGTYLHYTLEGILEEKYGSQLLTESITLFGCILLLIEHKIDGSLREKLLISYLRTNQSFNSPNLDQICSLCRTHNHSPINTKTKTTSNIINIPKPEDLFARFRFPPKIIDSITIACLRGAEMYGCVRFYTDSSQHTSALSKQGGHLYVLLIYSHNFLHDGVFMKEVVDRYFKDTWVVPVFTHFLVDLLVSWNWYKEAKEALVVCVSPVFIRNQCTYHCTKVKDLIDELDSSLSKSVLNKANVLENSQHILSVIRNCNFTLRWLLLHRMSKDKKARDIVASVCFSCKVDIESLLQFILKASKLEIEVKRLYKELLANKESTWHEKKQFVCACMNDLSQNHLGPWASSTKFKNKSLIEWFESLSSEVNMLEYNNGTGISGRPIFRVISALKDLERLHQIQENVQIQNAMSKAQKTLHDMNKILSLDKDFLLAVSVITDTGCAWGCFTQFEQILQNKIEKDPSNLLVLPALFLKFRSILSSPFVRIEQSKSQDLPCVLNYYSSKYSAKIFSVLDIIPVILLDTKYSDDKLDPLVLQSNRINKEAIEDFVQVDAQLERAREAAKLCLISEGILVMSRNFVGIINLNLNDWLEEKLRTQVSSQLESKLQSLLLSSSPRTQKQDELEGNLHALLKYISSQSQRLKFLQDILHIHGTDIWNDSFTLILEKCALTEENELNKQPQGHDVNISQVLNIQNPKSFLGLLLQKIIHLTDPSESMFIEPMLGWFDAEGNELLGLHFFTLLESCVGSIGLASLGSLLTKVTKINLENILKRMNTLLVSKFSEEMRKLDELLGPPVAIPLVGLPLYGHLIRTFGTSWNPLIDDLAKIGQLQLLLSLVNFRLKSTSKCKAGILNSGTVALISTISYQIETIVKANKTIEDSTRNNFLAALNQKRQIFGLVCPFHTIYSSEEDAPIFFSRFTSLLSISQLPRYVLDIHLGTLTSRSKKALKDFSPLIIGISTLMQQFHPFYATQYIQFIVQYIRLVESSLVARDEPNKGSTNHTAEVSKAVFWLRSFCKYMRISEDIIDSKLAPIDVLQS